VLCYIMFCFEYVHLPSIFPLSVSLSILYCRAYKSKGKGMKGGEGRGGELLIRHSPM
jgi:hypothetical protein